MKSIFTTIAFSLMMAVCVGTTAYAIPVNDTHQPELSELTVGSSAISDFLELTPRSIRKATGKKLKLKEIIQLKAAQKALKKSIARGSDEEMPKWLYILAAFFGLAWIIMGIKDDWSGKNWWVNIIFVVLGGLIIGIVGLLCPLLWLGAGVPGLIHALIKMKEYY